MARTREGYAYLQVRADTHWSGTRLKVIKSTQRKPDVIEPDCIVVKITLQVPDAAFRPLEPEAVVVVPEELVQHPVAVEAVSAE